MLVKLFLLFTAVPLLELALLIRVGQEIGVFNTLAIVVITGAAGAWLARAEGLGVLRRIRESIDAGLPPSTELIDGALILAGGILLLTPGLVTDAAGLLCLIPPTRRVLRRWVVQRVLRRIERRVITFRGL
ncbi:MAG: FxsA family protein [Candidatus Tectomicrobia bacterium]|nr:FxsA family protein [Candidatus Tectomicrobia bacterium]